MSRSRKFRHRRSNEIALFPHNQKMVVWGIRECLKHSAAFERQVLERDLKLHDCFFELGMLLQLATQRMQQLAGVFYILGGNNLAGDSFTLFTASSGITGSFSATNLPVLAGGLGWVTTNLANGVLSIVATVNTTPTNIVATVTGTVLNLTWPTDHIGWRLQVETNSLGAGLNPSTNAWHTVPGSAAVNTENIPMDPTQGTVFYRMVYP